MINENNIIWNNDTDDNFFLYLSESSLKEVWDNEEDEIWNEISTKYKKAWEKLAEI